MSQETTGSGTAEKKDPTEGVSRYRRGSDDD